MTTYYNIDYFKMLQNQANELVPLVQNLILSPDLKTKLQILRNFTKEMKKSETILEALKNRSAISHYIVESIYAIRQDDTIFQIESSKNLNDAIDQFIAKLTPVEQFYDRMGGIVGYHLTFLKLLLEKESECHISPVGFERPPGLDISQDTPEVRKSIKAGIDLMAQIAEIYPVAGAADRLDLHDDVTGEPLPAAEMQFMGYTLLEGLVRDLTAREYLHYKLTGQQITTPILLMTSFEKNNYQHIKNILKKTNWFHRSEEKFYLVVQPLVPMIRFDGQWAVRSGFDLILKPGGHGALWKIVQDQDGFTWLKKQNRNKALVRQLNNPIAGLDYGLISLTGVGCLEHKMLGFLSCERRVHSSEGVNVLNEKATSKGFEYTITNIEYTNFEQQGIQDIPEKPEGEFSKFPANTNLLFIDIKCMQEIAKKSPYPGLLINLKTKIHCKDASGQTLDIEAGRLESTMQNIADNLIYTAANPLKEEEKKKLPSFLLYNKRSKTIAVAKKLLKEGGSIHETPEGCFYRFHFNAHELLNLSGFTLPPFPSQEQFLKEGPAFHLRYDPALGPLFSIIKQKLKRGKIAPKSELILEISELKIENLNLNGSLIIRAASPLGHLTNSKQTIFSEKNGKCTLINVAVKNCGVKEWNSQLWKNTHSHHQSVNIFIEGNGEFYAENIEFSGSYDIKVPDQHRMVAVQEGQNVKFNLEKIHSPTWRWNYSWTDDFSIQLF